MDRPPQRVVGQFRAVEATSISMADADSVPVMCDCGCGRAGTTVQVKAHDIGPILAFQAGPGHIALAMSRAEARAIAEALLRAAATN